MARAPVRPPKGAVDRGPRRVARPRAAGAPAGRPSSGVLLLLAGGVVVLLGLAGLAVSLLGASRQLVGPTVEGAPPAPDFALLDQDGQRVQLSALRGKVVALTFLYTQCPDVCPLIAVKLGQADQRLGRDRADTALLAVSVDPANDTPAAVRTFNSQRGLTEPNWHYLVGSPHDLAPVWKSYFVGAVPAGDATNAINHTAIVYIIDRRGRLRVAFDPSFTVDDFVKDVHVLERSSS